MREFTLTIAIIFIIFAIIYSCHDTEINELREQNAQLLREIEQRKVMTNDMKKMALTAECKVINVDTEFTSREILWTLADILIENGCNVEIH